MDDLIEALQILRRYENPPYPTHCEHDVMIVCIDPSKIPEEDKKTLSNLGFIAGQCDASGGEDVFYSFRFGSA